MKTQISTYERAVQFTEDEAHRRLQAVADRIFADEVIPFCDKNQCRFGAGMGGFWFKHPSDTDMTSKFEDAETQKSNREWQRLYKILMLSNGLTNGHPIGSWMKFYDPSF